MRNREVLREIPGADCVSATARTAAPAAPMLTPVRRMSCGRRWSRLFETGIRKFPSAAAPHPEGQHPSCSRQQWESENDSDLGRPLSLRTDVRHQIDGKKRNQLRFFYDRRPIAIGMTWIRRGNQSQLTGQWRNLDYPSVP